MLKVSNKNTTTRGDLQKQAQSFAPYSFIKVVKVFFSISRFFEEVKASKNWSILGQIFLTHLVCHNDLKYYFKKIKKRPYFQINPFFSNAPLPNP